MKRRTVLRLRVAALVGAVVLLGAIPFESFGEQRAQQAPIDPPTGVVAFPLSVSETYLRWSQTADQGVYGYTIRRNNALLATLYGDVRMFRDTNVQASTTYTYTVTTLSTSWVDSSPSAPVVLKTPGLPDTPDTTPPSSPSSLSVELQSGGVLLDWYDASDDSDISAYLIRRDGVQIAIVRSGTLQYVDATAMPGSTYIYSVEALDVVGHHSAPSNLATIDIAPYPAP